MPSERARSAFIVSTGLGGRTGGGAPASLVMDAGASEEDIDGRRQRSMCESTVAGEGMDGDELACDT